MDASYELARAMFDRLRATPAVTAFLGQRLYDRVPERQTASGPVSDVPFPYLSLGPSTVIPDDVDCIPGEEITIQLDIWTNGSGEAYGSVQCRKICGEVKRALHEAELPLPANALAALRHEITRYLHDPNPAVSHGAIQFTATVEID